MDHFARTHFILPSSLRKELGQPIGELVKGSIAETLPVLKQKLTPHTYLLVAVGDVTANLFMENDFQPDIIVTDGQTKREALEEWKDWDGYVILLAQCPPAEITPSTWQILQKAIKLRDNGDLVHVKVEGEEDLLVLPLIIELPLQSRIVYGQPNTGAVIRTVTEEAKTYARNIVNQMDRKSDNT